MTPIPRPRIDCERQHPTIYAPDVLAAVKFYEEKLGFTVGFLWGDPTWFAGVNLDKVQMFIGQGTPMPDGCSIQFVVDDVDAVHAFHEAGGVEIGEPIADREYGMRDYSVRDINGYAIGFGQHIFNAGESILIERVDVPVRLEKRLAALLTDLAKHKRMSVSSALEEILLHTNEPLGDGVASPHTAGQLRVIQELKKKHGIDYDSHGSYRFKEKGS
jgi:catechol 2,3-dioxygenase-like lactoylglutathione lyase family enzyme